jgi:hypothetical protein
MTTAVVLFAVIAAEVLTMASALAQGSPFVDARSVWNPSEIARQQIADCQNGPSQSWRPCVFSAMKRSGASRQAIAFTNWLIDSHEGFGYFPGASGAQMVPTKPDAGRKKGRPAVPRPRASRRSNRALCVSDA